VLAVKKAARACVPFVDNEALYRLLGPSTYQPTHRSAESAVEILPQPIPTVPTGTVKPHLALVREEVPSNSGRIADASRQRIPHELREAVRVVRPGMTYRDLGRELGRTDGEARVLWQEMKKRGLLNVASAEPVLLAANGGHVSSYEIVEDASRALPTLPTTPRPQEREQRIQLGKDVSLTQEQFHFAVKLRKTGRSTGYRDLIPVFDLSEHHAKELNKRIRQALGQAPERESE
jgi:hypothetical protein